MPVRVELDEERLRRLVEVDELPQWRVAEVLGVSRDTIVRRCRKLGLKTQRTGPRSGDQHTGWKGGRKLVKGYVYIYRPAHPGATKQGYVSEHRLVMEQKLGRHLDRREVVHHLNEDPADNRPENLALYASNAEHLRATRLGRCPQWTPEGMERIRIGVIKRANLYRKENGVAQRSLRMRRSEKTRDTPSLLAS